VTTPNQTIINLYTKDMYANHCTTKMARKLVCKLPEETQTSIKFLNKIRNIIILKRENRSKSNEEKY
jgi:hypothetical protein